MTWRAKDITFGYGRHWVLTGVSLTLPPGQIVGLLGPSGQGKSTLGKIMAGWIGGYRGHVWLDEQPLPRLGGRPSPVQYLNQNPELAVNPRWRMGRVLTEGWTPDAETMAAMGIKETWLSRFPAEISGGELQRFCVTRALHPGLRYLVADEMTTMLDPITQAEIWSQLLRIARARDIGVLVITHNRALADRLCDTTHDLAQLQSPTAAR
ncbi:MAG: ABC transporter ATP-binding protein [Arachnia sp.]